MKELEEIIQDVQALVAGSEGYWTGEAAEFFREWVPVGLADFERCVKDLRGFAKTKLLAPGESETVSIPLSARDLAYFDELDHRFVTEAGRYEILVGTSSRVIRGRATVEVGAESRF